MMTNEAKRQCEMKIPDELVDRLEQLPGGIKPVLDKVEKEYGLSSSSPKEGTKHYNIAGPSPEILKFAMETLERRFLNKNNQETNDCSSMVNEIEDKRTVWKFFGEYARKASHLFLQELKELQQVDSVIVKETKNCLEITCSSDDTEVVKGAVDKLERSLHDLYEVDMRIPGKGNDINKLRKYIQNKQTHDKNILLSLSEDEKTIKVYGKSRDCVDDVVSEVKSGKATGNLVLPMLVRLLSNFAIA